MDDFVDALLACWGDDPVEHRGPFFSVPPSVIRPKPVQRPHPPLVSGMWSAAGLDRTRRRFDGWNPAGMPVARVAALAAEMADGRPEGMAPLTIHHRAFAQFPLAPTPGGNAVERLSAEAVDSANAGFAEIVLEHNFWNGVADPAAWVDVPELFAPVVAAAAG